SLDVDIVADAVVRTGHNEMRRPFYGRPECGVVKELVRYAVTVGARRRVGREVEGGLPLVVDARRPDRISRAYTIPSDGPHGLDLNLNTHRLFCACNSGVLVTLDAHSGSPDA